MGVHEGAIARRLQLSQKLPSDARVRQQRSAQFLGQRRDSGHHCLESIRVKSVRLEEVKPRGHVPRVFVPIMGVVHSQRLLKILASTKKMERVCFEDTFEVLAVDSERFDRVSRIKAQAQTFLAEIEVDINSEIYPVAAKETLSIALAIASEDGGRSGAQSLIDMYEYVMFGKVFKKVNAAANKVQVYASFGGLLMCLEGERSDMDVFALDDRVYLLVKKVH